MQDINETKQIENKRLYQKIDEININIAHDVRVLPSSLTANVVSDLWRRLNIFSACAIAIAVLGSKSAVASEFGALNYAQLVGSYGAMSVSSKMPSRLDGFTLPAIKSQRQWGPSLLKSKPSGRHFYIFSDEVKKQQEYLMSLGFDLDEADGLKGPNTLQVIAEFRALYLPKNAKEIKDADLAPVMKAFATLAHEDAVRYRIDQGVAAAIRLGSMRTDVDFTYLLKLAKTESSFNPVIEARNSSATGMYQFTKSTWLNTLKKHGSKYAIVNDYKEQIRYSNKRVGPFVLDSELYQHLLHLRKNPRMAAIMAAETVREHQQRLEKILDRVPSETDLYLAHFLGINNAIAFLQSLKHSPEKNAVELFPRAARNNQNIFKLSKTKTSRTVDEVYAHLSEKLSSDNTLGSLITN